MLGPLEAQTDDGAATVVGGARLRRLLILLALEPGRMVSSDLLIDGIWDNDPPMGAANALQALVSRLRRVLPGVEVESHPAGYRLVIEADAVDVTRFERLVAAGRSALPEDAARAARILREALDLWRGPALLDVASVDFFRAPVARLSELRVAALEDRIEADLRLGRGRELTSELFSLVAEHPLRERMVGALMRALVAAGRPAEALTVYERAREVLADELGADPSAELSALHTAVLRGEVNPAPVPKTPPVTVDIRPQTNLRTGLTSFVGRDEDVAQVGKLIGEYRLTTLTGPGGTGKTRLSVEAARPLLGRLPDGVWLVEFAPLIDGADVPQAVLAAMGLREQGSMSMGPVGEPLDRLVAALRTRSTLLVLDNCEHLIGAVAGLADRLLGECPRLRILATSREPLGITGEALWPVERLALPPEGAGVAEAMSYPAVRLLADRAVAARPGFEVTERTVPAVMRICRALDGLPLAIELAAARLRSLSAEQLAGRLDDRFRLLTGGSRMALPRHQTLRAVVDWSWDLLTGAERAVLRRLAVFSGGATVEAAERVCADGAEVLALLDALSDKSLLVATGEGRYRMLETIKAYGLERLAEAGERERIRQAHAAYFAELAEAADPHLRGAEQLVWLDRLTADHDNLNAALRGAIAAGDARTALRLVAAAGWYWWLSGHKAEGAELATEALALPGEVDTEVLAVACAVSVLFTTSGLGDEREAEGLLRKAQELAQGTRSRNPLIRLLEPLDRLMRSAHESSVVPLDAIDTALSDEDPWVRTQIRLHRARALLNFGGRHAEAEAEAESALTELRTIGERWGMSFALTVLADLVAQRGDLAAALGHYEQAIALATELGIFEDVLYMRVKVGQLRWLLGDPAGSAVSMAEAERDAEQVGWPDALAMMGHAKAELALWTGDLSTARTELARAEAGLRHLTVHPVFRAMIFDSLGYLDALEGDLASARAHRAEALGLALEAMHYPTVGQVLVGIADQALRQDQPYEAARLLSASDAVRGGPDLSRPDAVRVETATRAALGEEFARRRAVVPACASNPYGSSPRSRLAVEQLRGPEVCEHGDGEAPGDGDDPVVANRGAHQQPPDRLDDRGEGLVFGEDPDPGRHGVGGDERAAYERQQREGQYQVARPFGALAQGAECDGQPGHREGEQCDEPQCGDPVHEVGGGPESDQHGDTDDEHDADHGLDHAAEDVPDQYRGSGDGHGAEPGDDAFGQVGADGHRRGHGGRGHGHQNDAGGEVVDVVGAGADTGAQGATEDVDEQQQEDDRDCDGP
ncbi:MAG: AfsR/SARP family transcriptional regulator [Actinomycetia bacterium]|nr:AfsR/SARP family transcriptional regulator [Actinomycetes bacterium]